MHGCPRSREAILVNKMRDDIREYAKLGYSHFMLYPTCVVGEDVLSDTLEPFLRRTDIEAVDFYLPYNRAARAALLPALRACPMHKSYAVLGMMLDKLSLGSLADNEQAIGRMLLADQIDAAMASGAATLAFSSGLDVGEPDRQAGKAKFAQLCVWLCGELKQRGMTALLEPFDRDVDRKYLLGPTAECVEFIESLAPTVDNLKIQLDLAHVALMGENFGESIHAAADAGHLAHVHLGNCVKQDQSDPFFGDRHPPVGYPGGEIDVPELAGILGHLLEVGYLSRQRRGVLVIETQPAPGMTVEQTIDHQTALLESAWRRV